MISNTLYVENLFEESSDMEIPKQALQIVRSWDRRFTHDRITLNIDENEAIRKEYFEIFPVVIAKCMSYTSCITFEVTASSSSSSFREFSCGLLPLSSYAYDFNLGNAIGKLPSTYGIAESESIFHIASCGKSTKSLPELKNGDTIAMLLDINSENIDNTGNDGMLHIFINETYEFTFKSLDCSLEYAFAVTLSPNQSAKILPDIIVTPPTSMLPTEEIDDYIPTQYENDMHAESKSTIDLDPSSFLKCDEKNPSDARLLLQQDSVCPPSEHKQPSQPIVRLPISQLQQIPVPSFFPQQKSLLDTSNLQAKKVSSASGGENFDCCICLSATKCILFLPCKHLCVCEDCGMMKSPPISHCPICRLRIKNRMKVYM
jgi:hypothetical protein